MDEYITYGSIDRNGWFYQPNLVRWRHRFRGPRESLKINQEMGQYTFDILNMNAKDTAIKSDIDTMREHLLEGWDLDASVDFNTADAELIGIEEMRSRIERLRNRVRFLEKAQ